MAYTFDEVLSMYDRAKARRPQRWAGSDVYKFAQTLAEDDPAFKGVADDNWIQKSSRGLNAAIESTGLPEVSADFFGQLAGLVGQEQVGRDVGRTMPRMVANMAPLALGLIPGVGAPLALAGMGAMFGADTYAETDSPGLGVLSGATAMAMPGVFNAGEQMALNVAKRYGLKGITRGLVNVGTEEASKFVEKTVGEGIKNRLIGYLGGQAAGTGVMTGSAEVQSVAQGQGLFNPLSPEYLTEQVIGQIPFAAMDLPRLIREPQKVAQNRQVGERMETPAPEPAFIPPETEKGKTVAKELIGIANELMALKRGPQNDEVQVKIQELESRFQKIASSRTPSATTDRTPEAPSPIAPTPKPVTPAPVVEPVAAAPVVEPVVEAPPAPPENVAVEPTPEVVGGIRQDSGLVTNQAKALGEYPDKKGTKWTLVELEDGTRIFVASEKLTQEADGTLTFPKRFLTNLAPERKAGPIPTVEGETKLAKFLRENPTPKFFSPELRQLLKDYNVELTGDLTPAIAVEALKVKAGEGVEPPPEDLFTQAKQKAQTNAAEPTNDAAAAVVKVQEANTILGDGAFSEEEVAAELERKIAEGDSPVHSVNTTVQQIANEASGKASKDVVLGQAKKGLGKKAIANRAKRQEQFGKLIAGLPTEDIADLMTIYTEAQQIASRNGTDAAEADYRAQGVVLKLIETGQADLSILGDTGQKMDALDLQRMRWNIEKMKKLLNASKTLRANKDKLQASVRSSARRAAATKAEPDFKVVLQKDGSFRELSEGDLTQDVTFTSAKEAKLMANQLNAEQQGITLEEGVAPEVGDVVAGAGEKEVMPQGGIRYKVKASGDKKTWKVEKHVWFDDRTQYEEGGSSQNVDMSYGEADPVGDREMTIEDLHAAMGWDDPKESGITEAIDAAHEYYDETYGASMWDFTKAELDATVRGLDDLSNSEIIALNNGEPLNVARFRVAFKNMVTMFQSSKKLDWGQVKRLIYSNDLNHPAAGKLLATFGQSMYEGTYVGENGRLYTLKSEFDPLNPSHVGDMTLIGENGEVVHASNLYATPISEQPNLLMQGERIGRKMFEAEGRRPDEANAMLNIWRRVAALIPGLERTPLGEMQVEGDSNLKGLSNQSKPGVWLNLDMNSDMQKLITFGHELGHQVHAHLKGGDVPIEWRQKLDNAIRFVDGLDDQGKLWVMKLAFETLPKEFRNDPNVEALMARGIKNTDEMVANIISVSMMNAVQKPTIWRSMVEMMPKPLADFIFHVVDLGKSITNAIRVTMGIGVSEFGGYKMEKMLRGKLGEFNKTLNEMYRTHQELDKVVGKFLSIDQVSPEGYSYLQGSDIHPLQVMTLDNDRLRPALYEAGSLLFGRPSNVLEDTAVNLGYATKGWLSKFEHWMMPVRHLAEKFPVARYAFGIPELQQRYEQSLRLQFFSLLCTKPDGKGGFVKDPNAGEFKSLLSSTKLQDKMSDILRDRNFKGDKFSKADQDKHMRGLSGKEKQTMQHFLDFVDYSQSVFRTEDLSAREYGIRRTGAQIVLMKNKTLQWTKAVEVADKLWGAMKTQDPQAMQLAQGLLGADTMLDIYNFYKRSSDRLTALSAFYDSKAYYVTERRPGKFGVKYMKADGTTDYTAATSYAEQQKIVERLQRDPNNVKVEGLDPHKYDEFSNFDEGFIQKLRAYEEEMQQDVMGLVPDEEIRMKIQPYLSVVDEYLKDKATETVLITDRKLHREFKGERQNLNMVFNHLNFLQSALKQMARRKARADMGVQMLDKQVSFDPEVVSLIKKNYANYQRPDTKLGSMMNSGNFIYFLGANISNHVMEGAQWMVTLPSILTELNTDLGVVGSYRETMKAAKDVTSFLTSKKWKDADIQKLMDETALDIDHSLGSLSETITPDFLSLVQSIRLSQGQSIISAHDLLGNPVAMYANAMKALYQIPSKFNTRVALVAGYKMARKSGMSHVEAVEEARRVNRLANFNEGKAGRPVGPYDNKGAVGRTAAQMMMSLQTYSLGMISTFVRQAQTAFSGRTDIPVAKRRAARKALVQIATTQFTLAGALGLPFAGAAVALADQMFPELEAEKNMREWIAKLAGDDREMGGAISRLASDGLLNQISPFDFASRYGLSNVMGVSSMKGWDANNLLGPTASMVGSEFKAIQELLNGHMGAAMENAVPIGYKNIIKLYRDDWKIVDKNGNLMLDPTEAEKFGRAIGFAPTRLNNAYKAARMADRSAKIETSRRQRERDELVNLLNEGDFEQVKARLAEKGAEDPTFDANVEIRAITQKFLSGKFPADPSGGTATGAQTARLMGLAPTAPSQVQRLDAMTQLKQQLGAGRSLPQLRQNRRLKAMQADDLAAMGYFPAEDPGSVLGMY